MPGDTFHITASGNSFVNTGHTYQSAENERDKRAGLLNFLIPNWQSNKSLALYWDHHQARQKRVGRTGEWLCVSDHFKSWLREPNSFIWLQGIAGCGKTVLSSTIVDYLRDSSTGNNSTAGYYFNAREDEKRNVSRLLRSLVLQLCPTEGDLPSQVEKLYNKCPSQRFSDGDLYRALEDCITREGHTYIIIDALDECEASFRSGQEAEVEKLAKLIIWLTNTNTSNLHLLVTSRDGGLPSILTKELSNIVQKGSDSGFCRHIINLQKEEIKSKVDSDIKEFVEFELRRWNDRGSRLWLPLDEGREGLILDSVKGRANGMFRLAACLLDLVWRQESWNELESALDDLPPELFAVYDRIFVDIKTNGQMNKASTLLRWLLYSERPLSLEELTEIAMADSHGASFNQEWGADGNYVSLTLSSFVSISKDNLVQFAHHTVKDYLLSETTEEGIFAIEGKSQAFIATCCLSYMQFCGQTDLKYRSAHGTWPSYPKEYILLEYVFNNWYAHALRAWRDTTTADTPNERETSMEAAIPYRKITHQITPSADCSLVKVDDKSVSDNVPQSLSKWAHSVKLWLNGLTHIESALFHDTMKAIACKGYEKCVELILATETLTPRLRKYTNQSILVVALAGSYKELIRLMIDKKVAKEHSESAWWAQKWDIRIDNVLDILNYESHEAIVRRLVEHEVGDINLGDSNGWTALHTAAFQGHLSIVRLLLEKGADINAKDSIGRTALHIAASQGHDVVISLLLERGAELGVKDKIAWTALDLVVQKVVTDFYLQDTQAEIDSDRSRRIVPQAVQSNHETVARTIRLLLEREPNTGRSCDADAVRLVDENPIIQEETTKLAGSLFRGITVHGGRICVIASFIEALVLNAGSVRFTMSKVEELLVYGQFSPLSRVLPAGTLRQHMWSSNLATTRFEKVVIYGGTAAFSASNIRDLVLYEGSVIFSTTAQIGKVEIYGGTAAFSASNIRDLVLYEGSVIFSTTAQIGKVEIYGGTAAFSASNIRNLVLYEGSVIFSTTAQIGKVEIYGGTAAFSASNIRDLVLYEGSVIFSTMAQIENVAINGGTVVFSRVYEIYREIINLLAKEEAEVVRENECASSIIQIEEPVIREGYFYTSEIVQIGSMVIRGGIVHFRRQETALQLAARSGHDAIARLLLEKGADPNANSWRGRNHLHAWSPLQEASFYGRERIVRLLLEKMADVSTKDSNGQTALQLAASQGHTAIVRILEGKELDVDIMNGSGGTIQTLLQRAADVYNALAFFSRYG